MDRGRPGQLSREELYGLIADQEAIIARLGASVEELTARVAELEARLGGPPPGRQVPAFVKPARKKAESGKERRHRAQGYVRRLDEPTRQVEHALDSCQECGTRLLGGSVKRTRQIGRAHV